MYEIELKLRADHETARVALAEAGADHRGRVTQEDTYYDAPHRDFASTDEALRLRTERPADGTPETTLTYKGPLVEAASKTREEHETAVADADAAAAVLEELGFEAAAVVRKDRERFSLSGYEVVLDDVDGLGQFLEVETHAEDVAAAREGAQKLVVELGFDPEEHVRQSYLALLE